MKKSKILSTTYISFIFLLLYLPILMVVLFSFNSNTSRTASMDFTGFSLYWYKDLFDPVSGYGSQLVTSLEIAFWSVLISAVIGTLGAFGLIKRSGTVRKGGQKVQSFIEQLTMLPVMIPEIILGIAFLVMFSFLGIPFGKLTLVLSHSTFCIPYILITVKSRLITMDPSLGEAARDLGASPMRAFADIILPLAMPAIISGSFLAFAMSMDDFIISFFVNGAETMTLPLKVYSSVKVGITPKVNALCTVMLGSAFILVAVGQLFVALSQHKRNKQQKEAL